MPIKRINNFTFEECIEDAKKYESGKEWARCSKTKYRYARKHKWISDITNMIRPSEHIAMISPFDNTVIYRVFKNVGEIEN